MLNPTLHFILANQAVHVCELSQVQAKTPQNPLYLCWGRQHLWPGAVCGTRTSIHGHTTHMTFNHITSKQFWLAEQVN